MGGPGEREKDEDENDEELGWGEEQKDKRRLDQLMSLFRYHRSCAF